jgi:hypothetical protein
MMDTIQVRLDGADIAAAIVGSTGKNTVVRDLVYNPDKMNYREFFNCVHLFCSRRRVKLGEDKMCQDCPMIFKAYYCGTPPMDITVNELAQVFAVLSEAGCLPGNIDGL